MHGRSQRQALELADLAKSVRGLILLLALLSALRILTFPLVAFCVNTTIPLYTPLLLGLVIEPLRSLVQLSCRRGVRRAAMVGFATEALNASPTQNSGASATRAAFIAERVVSGDIPGFIAGYLATLSLLALSATRLGWKLVTAILFVLLGSAALGLVAQRRRQHWHRLLVETLRVLGAWMTVSAVDQGEIAADTSRNHYLKRVARASNAWSDAEARLERSRLWVRGILGALVVVGITAVIVRGDVPTLLRGITNIKNSVIASVADFIVLLSALPSLVLGARHWSALLGARSELAALRPVARRSVETRRRLETRPRELSISNLEVRYGSELGVTIDKLEVSLSGPLVLVGANGCGKSTLLGAIAGVLEAHRGSVRLDNVEAEHIDRSQVAFVPQEPVLIEGLTILDNARLVVPTVTELELNQYLEALHLKCDINAKLETLSRGERRRIAIARALLKYPRLLLLDEPDAWLDSAGRQCLLDALATIAEDTAIVIVTHRLEMAQFGKTIAVLGPDQALEAVGSIEQVRSNSLTYRTVIGS